MASVSHLIQDENANLDHDQLNALYTQLGAIGADDVLRRAMEELALRLSHLERKYRAGELDELHKGTKTLVAIADQIGMQKVVGVARDVRVAIEQNDEVALAATLSRLMRVGERSLTAIWDLQDMSI